MVFLIQATQNRDARAIHLKLDEIIRATEKARNEFIVAEKATEAQLDAHESELQELGSEVEASNLAGRADRDGTPEGAARAKSGDA
jgi:low affinity Fe/Cu permease